MPRKGLSLEEKIQKMEERAVARKARREKIAESRRVRLEAKKRKVAARYESERRRLQAQIAELDGMVKEERDRRGYRMVYPSEEFRAKVRQYRERNAWSVRLMARHCGVEPRQIAMIESPRRSIFMKAGAMTKVEQAVRSGSMSIPGDQLTRLFKIDHGEIVPKTAEELAAEHVRLEVPTIADPQPQHPDEMDTTDLASEWRF